MCFSRRVAWGCGFLVRRALFLTAGPFGFHPARNPASFARQTSEAFRFREPEDVPSCSFGPSPFSYLASAETSRSVSPRRPFSRKTRSPQVRTRSFSAQPPDLRCLGLDHESFAVSCPLVLPGLASYPVLVHRLTVSLHASSPRSVALTQLRFALLSVNSREDFHLRDRAHAGRTKRKRGHL